MSSSSVGWKAEGANLFHFFGVHSLNLEADELVGVGEFIAHGWEALCIGRIDFEDAQGNEVVGRDAVDLCLLKRAREVAGDVEEGVGLEFLGIEPVKPSLPMRSTKAESGVKSVAGEFAIVHGAIAGEACRPRQRGLR